MMINRINTRKFLNNECTNLCMTWYQLYNFLLGGRDVNIMGLDYKKEWECFV